MKKKERHKDALLASGLEMYTSIQYVLRNKFAPVPE